MTKWSGARIGVYVIVALLLIYLFAIGGMVLGFFASGEWIGIVMGTVLIVFPVLGMLFIWRDLEFAHQSTRLIRRMGEAGELPEDTLPKRPSGRPVQDAADAEFPQWADAVKQAPEDYRAWARLSLAYKASGDTNRARQAMRKALALVPRGDG